MSDEKTVTTVTTVQVGKRKVKLRLPDSFAIRSEVAAAGAANWRRGYAAALGLCWASGGRPKVQYAHHDYNPLAFGGAILDELVGKGIPADQVHAAGGLAYDMILRSILGEDEVAEAEDFSEAGGDSTS